MKIGSGTTSNHFPTHPDEALTRILRSLPAPPLSPSAASKDSFRLPPLNRRGGVPPEVDELRLDDGENLLAFGISSLDGEAWVSALPLGEREAGFSSGGGLSRFMLGVSSSFKRARHQPHSMRKKRKARQA